jgi:hypothetical protein
MIEKLSRFNDIFSKAPSHPSYKTRYRKAEPCYVVSGSISLLIFLFTAQ